MVPRSGEKFHFELLKTVLRHVPLLFPRRKRTGTDNRSAPISFFVTTDTGVTLNRFSQDLQLIDMELPVAALNTFTSTLQRNHNILIS
jgi:ATP-binding cassette, subfamily C (CFTR/MRP), member 1